MPRQEASSCPVCDLYLRDNRNLKHTCTRTLRLTLPQTRRQRAVGGQAAPACVSHIFACMAVHVPPSAEQGGFREQTFTCKHKYSLKRFLVRVCFGRRNEWSAVFWALLLSKQHSKQAGRSLCFDHLFCLLLSAHAGWQPEWAKSSRQNRWSMHTHRQECHLRKRKNIALGTFLNSGLAQWANKKNSSFKPSYAHPYKWTQKE